MSDLAPPSVHEFTRFLTRNCERCRSADLIFDGCPEQIRCPHLRLLAPLVFKRQPVPRLLAAAIDSFNYHLEVGQHFTLPDKCRMLDYRGGRGRIGQAPHNKEQPPQWPS
jgi:hypothetical protein